MHRRRARGRGRCFRGALLAGLLLAAGCGPEPPAANLLLVSIDTLRADHTSLHGYARETTPVLERLAAEGTRFSLAYAPSSTTGPSHASLFTGLHPIAHGVVKNGRTLAEEHATLAEVFRAEGYQTFGAVSSFVLHSKFGYAQGFEGYDDALETESSTMPRRRWEGHRVEGGFDRRADATVDRALAWLREARDPGRPFLLFVHLFDPHFPYDPPERHAGRFAADGAAEGKGELAEAIRRYDEEIAFADAETGRLLRALEAEGLAEETLVVVTADHGEGLMDHGFLEHGVHVYEEYVRVPLVVRFPGGVREGRTIDAPVWLGDVAPTLLELLAPPEDALEAQGRSLAGALRGRGGPEAERPVFLHRRPFEPGRRGGIRVNGPQFAVRQGPWKYIAAPLEESEELYHLGRDPGETRNLRDEEPERARALEARLARWRERHERAVEPQPELSEEDRARLEALGYVE